MSFDRTFQPKQKQKSAPTIVPASRLRDKRAFELLQYPPLLQTTTGCGPDFSRMAVPNPFPVIQASPLSIAGPRACPFGGACHACPPKIQAKLAVNQPGDEYEQEADRVAEAVMQGRPGAQPGATRGAPPVLQRQEAAKPKSEGEKYTAAAGKLGEAFLETDLGKKLKAEAARLGKGFIGSLAGKIITGAAAVGTVTTLAATHSELPLQVPEIPLDALVPGLKVKLTYKGPVDRPTEAAVLFSYTFGAGQEAEKKPALSEREKYRAETARMAAEQEKFREGLKSPDQRAREKELFERAFWSTKTPLGLEPLKIPGLKPKREELLMRQAEGGAAQHTPQAIPPIVHEVLRSPGQPLDAGTRAFMESRFGHDFSRIRVHHDEAAAASARAVNALAYTVGRDIVFAPGQYVPGNAEGRRLIAHELAHTVQQRTTRLVLQRQGPKASTSTPTYAQLEALTTDAQLKLNSATKDQEKKAAVKNALRCVGELETVLAQVKVNPVPSGPPSEDDVRDFITRITSTLVSQGFRSDVLEVAKQSRDLKVQAKIIEFQLAPASGAVSDEQQFLMELSKIVGKPLPPKQPNEPSGSWLEQRTEKIGEILAELNRRGMTDSSGRPLGMKLSSSLMKLYFKDPGRDIRPDPMGRVAGLTADPSTKQLLADCDVLATYAMRLLKAQGWTPVGYMAITTNELKPDSSGPRDSHVVALLKRSVPGGSGDAYLGISDTEFRDLGTFANNSLSLPELLKLALDIYSPALQQYNAYFLQSSPTGPDAGRYDVRLLDPVRNNLPPYSKAP